VASLSGKAGVRAWMTYGSVEDDKYTRAGFVMRAVGVWCTSVMFHERVEA
jgi:hypothetical protein